MLLSERKQRKIFDMLRNGDSVRKIAKTVHVAQSTVQEYKKIYEAIKAGKLSLLLSGKTRHSSRIQSIIALGYEFQADQPYENLKNNPAPAADVLTNTQILIQCLSQDLEQSENKNKELERKVTQVADERDNALKQKQNLEHLLHRKNQEHKQLKQSHTEQTTKLEAMEREIQELKDTTDKQRDLMKKMMQDHEKKLQEQNEKADQEKTIMQNEHDKYLLKITDDVNEMCTIIHDLKKDLHDVTIDRDKYKSEVERLEKEHENDLFKFATVAFGGVVGGAVISLWLWWKNTNSTLPVSINYGKNIEIPEILLPEPIINKSDIHHTYSGETLRINTPGTMYSGAVYHHNGLTSYAGTNAISYQPDDVTDSSIYHINSGINPVIYTSGNQSSRTGSSNHVETLTIGPTIPIPPTTITFYNPPPITPIYFYPQYIPVPPELIGPFGWIPIRKMKSHHSLVFLCWLFTQLGYNVIVLDGPHDKGGDILIEGFGEKIIIQVKHRKENTGNDALGEVSLAKIIYRATKARVISFSAFTRDAVKNAKIAGIELWELDRVIDELHRSNIYYPID